MNNKGYMLVEIILASFIAFGIGYFILNMAIKLKNKNDDLLVMTQVKTDQAIVMNKIMDYATELGKDFDCNLINVNGNVIKYDGNTIDIVNKYATVGSLTCNKNNGILSVRIPLMVKQMSEDNFDIVIDYNYGNY